MVLRGKICLQEICVSSSLHIAYAATPVLTKFWYWGFKKSICQHEEEEHEIRHALHSVIVLLIFHNCKCFAPGINSVMSMSQEGKTSLAFLSVPDFRGIDHQTLWDRFHGSGIFFETFRV